MDEVVIGAPYAVSLDLINHFRVALVIHGQTPCDPDVDGRDPYEVPKALGKFQQIDSGNDMSTQDIITRIIDNRCVHFSPLVSDGRFLSLPRLDCCTRNVTRRKKPKKRQPMKLSKN